jgi:cytochrome oxidase assembly protein ShyY1
MESTENQTKETDNNVSLAKKRTELGYMNIKKRKKSQPITQVQKESVITNEDLPNPLFHYGFTFFIVAIVLSVFAIYYGIINP